MSTLTFSPFAVHSLNETQEIDLGFPGSPADWRIRGDKNSFQVCEKQLCIRSASAARASLVIMLAVDKQQLTEADHFLVSYTTSSLADVEFTSLEGKPSVFYLSPVGRDLIRFRSLSPMVFLEEGQKQRRHWGLSEFRQGVEVMRFLVVVRSTGAWVINPVLHTVRYSPLYKTLRWVVYIGWFFLLLLLTVRVQYYGSVAIKLLRGVLAGSIIFAGASTIGSIVIELLSKFLASSGLQSYKLAFGSWQAYGHVSLHLLGTVYFCYFRRSLNLTLLNIIALNFTVALAIECVQMGIPGRSSDVADIGLGLVGMSAAFVIFSILRILKLGFNS